jgi:alkaline phosphatase D
MSTLRKPALGPVVGHTTHQSCRLWIAASDALDEKGLDEDRRTIGVLGVVGAGGRVDPAHIYYFRLRREFDRTGTFNLGKDVSMWRDEAERVSLQPFPLQPASPYRVRMASLNLDDAYPNDHNVPSEWIVSKLPPASAWADKLNRDPAEDVYAEAVFTTQPAPPASQTPAPLSFLLGSCRYPGLLWKRKEADRIFGPMLDQHIERPVNFTLMVGDQIYADMFNRMIPIGLADTYEEFQERYHTAFGSRNMRQFLSHVPTYMILDDHEIEDNWTQDRLHESNAKRMLFNLAIGAYMSYQWSHGPRFEDSYVHVPEFGANDALKRLDVVNLFYDFVCAGYPFFVLDTRTQRYQDDADGLADNHLLGRPSLHPTEPSQLDRVCAWLTDMQRTRGNVPKFIVSSSVFLPNGVDTLRDEHKAESDSWPGFPNTRRALLETIVKNKVENVVFLSGDIHCSSLAQMEFTGAGTGLTAYSIVSSAFYWPFSFADGDPADYVHDSRNAKTKDPFKLSGNLGTMHYTAWAFTQDDNFCRLDLDPTSPALVVQAFDWDGNPIARSKQDGSLDSQPERLTLAKW